MSSFPKLYFQFSNHEYNSNAKSLNDGIMNNSFAFVTPAEALAAQVSEENYDKGLIYPPFTNIRKISANIAANVAAKAYELGETFSSIMLLLL